MKLIILSLILGAGILSAQVPGIVWDRTHGTVFHDVHETQNGNFIVAGRSAFTPPNYPRSVLLYDSDGYRLWEAGADNYYERGYWVEEIPGGGGFISTGRCRLTSASTYGLHLMKVDYDGNVVWQKIYDIPDSNEYGYCVTCLPDGGFAVCGAIDPSIGLDQAWIMRTDSNGDTLWTTEWGIQYHDQARRIIEEDGGLTVLMYGRVSPSTRGPYIVHYDLMGSLLWETPVPDLYGNEAQDMCLASDADYIVLTQSSPWIAHVDATGNTQWMTNPIGIGHKLGYSINPTMDGGYIYAGENQPGVPEQDEHSGMIVKLDSEGNQQWWDFVYESDCDGLFSARQLSQGGYIASGIAGGEGYLIRYEPEVGIEGDPVLPETIQFDMFPNPFSSSLSISFSLPEPGQVELSVYDLYGRCIENLESGSLPSGEYSTTWNPDATLLDGCYLIVLDACGERVVRRCVKLD